MLKQTVHYTDFEDRPVTETLRFNLSKSELLEQDELRDRLEEMSERFDGEERELTPTEIKEILEVIKHFMELSYGIMADLDGTPNENGKRFMKSPQIWEAFTQTAAYDSYIMSLFEDGGSGAVAFMAAIIPKDLRQAVLDAQQEQRQMSSANIDKIIRDVANNDTPVLTPTAPQLEADEDEPDIDALLATMPAEGVKSDKTPIARSQSEFLKTKLSKTQYDKHMADKVVVD